MPLIILVEFRSDRSIIEALVDAVPEIGSKFVHVEYDVNEEPTFEFHGIVDSVEHRSVIRPKINKLEFPGRVCGTTIVLREVKEQINVKKYIGNVLT